MSTTEIEGACVIHTVITDACMRHHGSRESAFDEAVRRVRKTYDGCVRGWGDTPDVDYHLALTVDSPRHKENRERAEAEKTRVEEKAARAIQEEANLNQALREVEGKLDKAREMLRYYGKSKHYGASARKTLEETE